MFVFMTDDYIKANTLFICIGCVQRSWTTLAGASPVAVIASEPRS